MALSYSTNKLNNDTLEDIQKSKEIDLQMFDHILQKLFHPPGLDATCNMKLKTFEKGFEIPPELSLLMITNVAQAIIYKRLCIMIELCLRAMTPTILLKYFDADIDHILKDIIPSFFKDALSDYQSEGDSKDLVMRAFNGFIKTKNYYHDNFGFRKFFRDRRSQVLNCWHKNLRMKPQTLVHRSLESVTYQNVQFITPSSKQPVSASGYEHESNIFGFSTTSSSPFSRTASGITTGSSASANMTQSQDNVFL